MGHVNKDGAIAGPKVMEHIVDTVLYFEGDKMLPYRILRAAKNRYGSTNELGMFDMTGQGLEAVSYTHLLDGAGKTVVMVTLESGEETSYAVDTQSGQMQNQETHVLLEDGSALEERCV